MATLNRPFVGIVVGLLFSFLILLQGYNLYKFIAIGERFTADDGKKMSQRIVALEARIDNLEKNAP